MFEGIRAGMRDLLFPGVCQSCGNTVRPERGSLCWDCRSSLRWVQPPYCSCCGNPVEGQISQAFTCLLCSSSSPAYEAARSAVRYDGAVAKLLKDLKYNGALWCSNDLGQLLFAAVSSGLPDIKPDFLTWVPSQPERIRARGYSPSRLLAQQLGKFMGRPVKKAIKCARFIPSQTNLTASQRVINVQGAFVADRKVEGRAVLLVDDTMTTGSTVDACSRALLRAGADRVWVVTVARR